VGFLVLTITRTAWITAMVVLFFYLVLSEIVLLKRKGLGIAISIITFLLVVGISIPIEYLAVRYFPPMFHHPIWYEGEYNEDKVHSWDPVDSEKYVSYNEFMDAVWERIEPYTNLIWQKLVVNAQEKDVTGTKEVDFESDMAFSSARGRFFVWKYYLENGTMVGHSSKDGHIIDGAPTYIWHTQNMFVQFWYYYGIPSAIFLIIILSIIICIGIKNIFKQKSDALICVLYIILFAFYGFFEATWYPGQIVLFLAFYTPKFLFCEEMKNV